MVKIKLLLSYILGKHRKQMIKQISKRSFIVNKVQFLGIHNIEILDNCTIGENTTFTVNDISDKEIRLKIGSNTYIGRNNFFSVGKYVNMGPYLYSEIIVLSFLVIMFLTLLLYLMPHLETQLKKELKLGLIAGLV